MENSPKYYIDWKRARHQDMNFSQNWLNRQKTDSFPTALKGCHSRLLKTAMLSSIIIIATKNGKKSSHSMQGTVLSVVHGFSHRIVTVRWDWYYCYLHLKDSVASWQSSGPSKQSKIQILTIFYCVSITLVCCGKNNEVKQFPRSDIRNKNCIPK